MSDAFIFEQADSPVLIHVPHASKKIPDDAAKGFVCSAHDIARELEAITDHDTDAIGRLAAAGGRASTFINQLSRLVVDPERFPDDREIMRQVGMGAIYTRLSDGRALRDEDTARDAMLLEQYFFPYARALADAVEQVLDRHGRCVIIDLHSYPREPLPYELDHQAARPQVCIGTDPFHTPHWLAEHVHEAFRPLYEHVADNTPFAGTYVPDTHYQVDRRVASVMLELRRDIYRIDGLLIDDALKAITGAISYVIDQISS